LILAALAPAVDLAELELRRGAWVSAWPRYEARLGRDDRDPTNVVRLLTQRFRRWNGQALASRTLLIYSEQGHGDDIQVVRFIPELAARVRDEGGRLVLAARLALKPLFARLHADCVSIEEGVANHADFALPIMSLPFAFDLRPEQVSSVPYLTADAQKVATRRARLQAGTCAQALHVGLVWSGNPAHRRDAMRSIALSELAVVLALPGIAFYPLTPGRDRDVAALTGRGYLVWDLTGHYADGFDDVAAHAEALDAVLTIDSAPLHLGGALGCPVLAMLDHVSHWCWGVGETQPWYQSVELFRQPHPGDWGPVVERVAARLRVLVVANGAAKPMIPTEPRLM